MTSLNPNFVWSPFHLSVMNSIHHWQHVRERTYNNNNKDGITTHFFYRAAIQVWPKAFDSINSFNWSLLALINCATVLCATRHQLDCREGWTITDVMLGNESQPSVDIAPLIESGDVLGGEKFFFYCLADADDTRPRPSLRRRSGRGFQLWCTVLGFPNHLNGGLGGGVSLFCTSKGSKREEDRDVEMVDWRKPEGDDRAARSIMNLDQKENPLWVTCRARYKDPPETTLIHIHRLGSIDCISWRGDEKVFAVIMVM